MWSDAERLEMLKAVGAEEFDTGRPERLWGVFESEFFAPELGGHALEGQETWLECRLSDVAAHELIKDSQLTRVADGKVYLARRFEPSQGAGFAIIRLRQ